MIANLLEALESTVRRVPERVAFYDDRESLTYAELMDTAKRLGTWIAHRAAPRSAVALLMDARSIHNLPCMFGAIFADCFYAPMDIAMPPERLCQLLELLSPAVILGDDRGLAALAASGYPASAALYETVAETAVEADLLETIRRQASVFDPVSVLYTSGSTGVPKGSVLTQSNYIHWTEATIQMYGLDENVVFGNQSPFFYANSVIDVFPPVWLGATVYLLPAGALSFPRRMLDCLNEHRVAALCMTPSSFVSLVSSGALTEGCAPWLRWGIMSGESMPWAPLQEWMRAAPNADWWHFYGSTEMLAVAVGKVNPGEDHSGARLPVGRLFPHVHLLFVEEDGREAEPGQPGEMYVSSPWVSQGYYRDPERTAQSWVEHPLGTGWLERFYRSGDMGYLRPDGQLMVLGRRDSQIKHMGYRMELGEVEAALRRETGVQECCALLEAKTGKLYCFYTGSVEEKALRHALREHLARYMLPDVFKHLDSMPHTSSMKLDRAALIAMMEG